MKTDYQFLKISEQKNILFIHLNRPEIRNAFNPAMIQEITQAFLEASQQKKLRAVVLKGEGKVFCAGGDLNWMKAMVDFTFAENVQDSEALYQMFQSIQSCAIPVVAVVHAAAFGGALGLIACADIVIAEEKTQLCFSEVKIGIAPAVISKFILDKVPLAFVQEAMLTAKVFLAGEAQRMGLVQYVEEEDNLQGRLDEVLSHIADCGPEAVRETKKLIHSMKSLSTEQQKKQVTHVIAERRASAEGQEGLKSFLEKRNPNWRNS